MIVFGDRRGQVRPPGARVDLPGRPSAPPPPPPPPGGDPQERERRREAILARVQYDSACERKDECRRSPRCPHFGSCRVADALQEGEVTADG